MVHLPALPGAPGNEHPIDAIETRAVADARTLADGGIDAVLVENYGDAPYYRDSVPDHTVAAMTRVADAVVEAVDCPVGINVLRNDATAAMSIAAAVDAAFVRINVHTGARITDQGIVEGNAAETIRLRDRLDADVAILADHEVKYSAPLSTATSAAPFVETVGRGGADAIVVSGSATGDPVPQATLETVLEARAAVDSDAPVVLGSGVTPENATTLLADADGAIVGTALKQGGKTTAPVDPARVEALVTAVD